MVYHNLVAVNNHTNFRYYSHLNVAYCQLTAAQMVTRCTIPNSSEVHCALHGHEFKIFAVTS